MSDITQEHDRDFETTFMQSAGPITRAGKTSFFDVNDLAEKPVVPPGTEEPPEGATIKIQALVNPDEPGAVSLLGVRYAPNAFIDRHKHNLAQIVLVLEGEVRQGNKTFGPGQGYYTPAGAPYAVQVGPRGAKLVEFRPGWLQFTTDWVTSATEI